MTLRSFAEGAIAGAAAGIVGDKVRDRMEGFLPHEHVGWEDFREHFPEQWERLLTAVEAMAQGQTLVPIRKSINLFAYPQEFELQYFDRQHISIFVTSSFAVRCFVVGAGVYNATLNAGWNSLEFSPGSTIALPSGTAGSQPALYLASEVSMGSPI